jgi:hypothetical protein
MLALWAEMNVVVADEFRDGNVPALKDPVRVAKRAFAALPDTIRERYFRGDSACDEEELLSWLREVNYFAVATNLWDWKPKRLLEWHREKAGSIEAIHEVIKNELGGGVLPCGRYGANAAWFRLAVMTHNVLTAMKRLALPPELLTARPKRLRFLIFNTPGRLIRHARAVVLRCLAERRNDPVNG